MYEEQPEIEFLSPSLVTDKCNNQDTTPQPTDASTPNKDTDMDERLELHQIKIVPQKQKQEEVSKIVNQLHKMAFHETGYLNNTTKIERLSISALAINTINKHYKLGRYNPSDKLTDTYRNKEVIKLHKIATEERLTKTNTLYKLIY